MSDFSELEADLKQLRPAAASPELATRIEHALAAAASASTPTAGILPRPKLRLAWFALGLGAAAAAAFLMLARLNFQTPAANEAQRFAAFTPAPAVTSESSSGFVPDGLTRVVYNTRDEGLVFPVRADEPVRRVRSRTRETLKWRDPGTGASLHVSYPTDEV